MSLAIVIHATERSSIQASAPTTPEIVAAMRRVSRDVFGDRQRTALNGDWVGPAPRVTRSAPVGAFVTQAAWVWLLSDAQQAASGLSTPEAVRAFTQRLVDDTHAALRSGATHNAFGDDWTVEALGYSEAVNGPLAWWRSGEATRATFVDSFPELTTRTLQLDNPIGPTHAQPSTGFGGMMTALAVIAAAVAVTMVAVEVAPAFSALAVARPRPAEKTAPTANPGRRRR